MPVTPLTQIPGIGPATAQTLTDSGFGSVEAIARASAGDLAKVQGFGQVRASVVIAAAQALMTGVARVNPPADAADKKERKKKRKKDKKKDSKGKKGKKKKTKKKKDKKKDSKGKKGKKKKK